MVKEAEKSLGEAQTRLGGKQHPLNETDTSRSLGDSQTLIGGLNSEAEALSDGLELTDLSTRYTFVKTLGQGGMGEVLLATDTRLKRQVAIKRIRGEQAKSRAALQRFLTEAQSIAALNHPNIVQVYDYGRDQEGPFLIMEYVDGQSLLERCKDNPLPVEEAVEMTCELLGGLGRAHELGIIHRDIKPANILLTRDGRPKLTDFGLAKQTTADHGQTVTGAVLGTIDFMPPEQRRDATLVDARSDLWSLAATLYQMLTGKSPKVIRLDLLPKQLVETIGKALEESPSQRFQSAAEFRDALRRGLQAGHTSGELAVGQCPQCGTRNSETVRFCKECSTALQVPCLSCERDIPVWNKGCTECGARQADLLESKRAELQKLQAEVEQRRESGQIVPALRLLDSAGALRHPQLSDYRHWMDRTAPALKEQVQRLVELADGALAEAKSQRAAWNYPAAIRALKSMPPEASGEEHQKLLNQLQSDWTEVQKVVNEIQQRVKAKQLDGLLPLVRRAVELRGDRDDLKKLLGQLEQREARMSAVPAPAPTPVSDPLREAFELPNTSASLPGFFGKRQAKKSWWQQYGLLTGAISAGLFIVLAVGWMLSRSESRKEQAAASAPSGKETNLGRERSEPETKQSPSTGDAVKVQANPAAVASPSVTGAPESKPSLEPEPNANGSKPKSNVIAGGPPEIGNSIGMRFRLLPAGTFLMGITKGSLEDIAHQVTLSYPFGLGIHEVTQSQYERVMGVNPSHFKKVGNHPVESVSSEDAIEFCRKLSELPEEKAAGRFYRLPTEAEWEYACRAGSSSQFCFGDDEKEALEYAWCQENSGRQPHPVGEKKPNAWGLYDMHGNVWEWCSDWYASYPAEAVTDPFGPREGTLRARHGGGFPDWAKGCKSFARRKIGPANRIDACGFRVVVILREPYKGDKSEAGPSGDQPGPSRASASQSPTEIDLRESQPIARPSVKPSLVIKANEPPPSAFVNSIGMNLKLIPAGKFTMGEGKQAHQVTLTKPYYLGVYEVTQEKYELLVGKNPSNLKSPKNPVETVTWNEAVEFCRKLSELPEEKAAGLVYRLPTEAEWEYACRAGKKTAFSFGDDEALLDQHGWFNGNSDGKTSPVGQKKPNAFGLYDMHGNVGEHCADWFDEYPRGAATDPIGPDRGTLRVIRGGGRYHDAAQARSANRGGIDPARYYVSIGFRVAVSLPDDAK